MKNGLTQVICLRTSQTQFSLTELNVNFHFIFVSPQYIYVIKMSKFVNIPKIPFCSNVQSNSKNEIKSNILHNLHKFYQIPPSIKSILHKQSKMWIRIFFFLYQVHNHSKRHKSLWYLYLLPLLVPPVLAHLYNTHTIKRSNEPSKKIFYLVNFVKRTKPQGRSGEWG